MQLFTRAALAAVVLAGLAAPAAQQRPVPAPEEVIGFPACADHRLATYEQALAYFRALDAASDRVRLVEIGPTAEGRTQVMAIISSKENLGQAERLRRIAARLALARDLTDGEAKALAADGRAVVSINFGLHSTEVAHAQAAPELAWRVVTGETAELRFIRDNVILLLVPNLNPDGTTLVAEWHRRHAGTPFAGSDPPELYHRYAGHDNNRDWFMFNLPESRNVARQLYREWFPQIVHDHHQDAPFPARIFVPPFREPTNPNIPPLVMRGVDLVGKAMSRRLEREGKTGAISGLTFDAWWNGGMRTAPYYHNMIGILTETAHASAAPVIYDAGAFPSRFADGTPTLQPTDRYPHPYRGGYWRLRDSCEYMITASMAALDIGARRREEWLYGIYRMGRDAIRAGADETYVVPIDQRDAGTAVRLVNVLRVGGVEVERAIEPFRAGGRTFPAGSFVIRGAQPFRPYLTDLLNPQAYPDRRLSADGPPERPYDITGWTLPMQMGVEVVRLDESVPGSFEAVDGAAPPAVRPPATAHFAYAIDGRSNDAFLAANRLLGAGATILRAAAPVGVAGDTWPAGTFLVRAGTGVAARVAGEASSLGLRTAALDDLPAAPLLRLRAPRVGLYRPWGGNIDEGWTRWILEQFEFGFETLRDRTMRKGDLQARFDVIVLPGMTYEAMLNGLAPGSMPERYTGGMTRTGVSNLRAFVEAGGTLVALDTAAGLPLALFDLPVRDVSASQPVSEFFVPGTLVRIALDASHPVAFGMPDEAAAFFARSPVFSIRGESSHPGDPPGGLRVVARYASPPRNVLMSGWLRGPAVLAGRPAVVEARLGRGRIVLLGFRAQHRAQAHGTFKLLFNSLYLGAYVAD